MKFLSITVLILLTVAPMVTPLLAQGPCCSEKPEPTLANCDDCCHVTALPETAAKATLAVPPALVAPAQIAPAPLPVLMITAPPAAAGQILSSAPVQAPLRI